MSQLKNSDVAFMYTTTKDIYEAYRATWVAWGGATTNAVKDAHELGIHYAASMWTLTAGAENIHKRSDLRDAVSKDILLEPIKVPWLWDHTYEGTPSYFGCTNHPVFREFSKERVSDAMKTCADGLHIDDHLGTAGSFWHGGCFCDYCINGFRNFLKESKYKNDIDKLGINLNSFSYRDFIKKHVTTREEYNKRRHELPLIELFQTYQVKSASKFVSELRKLAEDVKGGEITCSANTGIPNPMHLVVTPNLTHCVCEVEFRHGNKNAPESSPISAFKAGDAIGKPVCATASGWDWAYAHTNNNAVGLVRLWIAESYALGHRLMVPHRKWAFTTEKGTHWYQSKPEDFAYLYNFVRDNNLLFDDYESFGDIALIFCNKSIRRRGLELFQDACKNLADRNMPFSVIIAGDDWLEDQINTKTLDRFNDVIIPEPSELNEQQKEELRSWKMKKYKKISYIMSISDLLSTNLKSPIEVKGAENLWILPRIKQGSPLVCHLLNRNYNESKMYVDTINNINITIDKPLIGNGIKSCRIISPDKEKIELYSEVHNGKLSISIPEIGMWSLLVIE